MTQDPPRRTAQLDPVVRPITYVEPVPVVRRIGDRALYLGNVHAADPDRHDREFGAVLSLTAASQPGTTHHHPLDDGPDNEWATFAGAIDAARRLLGRDGSLLVHCKAGVSRSSTVLATALAAEEERGLRESLAAVRAARPVATPHPALYELAVYYLAAEG